MKKFILIFGVLLMGSAQASILGTLISQRSVTTVTGLLAWECTYMVAGRTIEVTVQNICPVTMYFD